MSQNNKNLLVKAFTRSAPPASFIAELSGVIGGAD